MPISVNSQFTIKEGVTFTGVYQLSTHFFANKKIQWPVFIVLALLFIVFRYPVPNQQLWANIGLVRFNKIHIKLLSGQYSPSDKSIINVESFLHWVTQTNNLDSKNHSSRQALALILIAQGRLDEAIETLQNANIDPIEFIVAQGRYANSATLNQQALDWYYKAINLDPDQAEIWFEIGLLHADVSQTEDATHAFQKSWDLSFPDSADPLAKLLRSDGNHLEAIDVWQSALSLFPHHPDRLRWWRGLCISLRATQKWDQADEVSELAVIEFPNDAQLHIERGFALYYKYHRFSEATQEFEKAVALDANIALAYAALGEIFAEEELFGKSIEWYEKAINLDSNNSSWYTAQAEAAFSNGDLQQALDLYKRVIRLWPNISYTHYRIALLYRQASQPLEAIRAIEQAISLLEQPNTQYFYRAATIYEWAGENEKAVSMYRQILLIEPENETAVQSISRLLNN